MAPFFREMQHYSRIQRWTLIPSTLSSWLCLQLLLHLVFIQSGMLVAVMGLSLESISVPRSGIKGSSVILQCEYRLKSDEKLYSLKWYKDSHEFYRYMPSNSLQPITKFQQDGVHVEDVSQSQGQDNKVVFKLKNLGLRSMGVYKCEVSADVTYQTLAKESNLSVIVLPNPRHPNLVNFPRQGQMGDRIRGNCSYFTSYPPANLTFYVNDVKVNNSEDMKVKMYEPQVDGVIDDYHLSGTTLSSSSNGIGRQHQYQQQHQQISSSSIGRDGMSSVQFGSSSSSSGDIRYTPAQTYTSVSGIEFRLERHHFERHTLTIRCVASVVDQVWDTVANITLHNYQPRQLPTSGQNRYASGSSGYLKPFQSFATASLIESVQMAVITFAWAFTLC